VLALSRKLRIRNGGGAAPDLFAWAARYKARCFCSSNGLLSTPAVTQLTRCEGLLLGRCCQSSVRRSGRQ
jgi:hypothetical protein